ncbi:hypothetical protein [Paenibacillus sp. FSL E2-0177]
MNDGTDYYNLDELFMKINEAIELVRYQENIYWSGYFVEEFQIYII